MQLPTSDNAVTIEFAPSQQAILADAAVLAGGGTSVDALFEGLSELLARACLFEHLFIWAADSRHMLVQWAAGSEWSDALQDQVVDEAEAWLQQHAGAGPESGETDDQLVEQQPVRPPLPTLEAHGIPTSFLTLHGLDSGHLRILVGYGHHRSEQNPATIFFSRALARILASALNRIRSQLGYISVRPEVLEAKHHWEATVDALPQLIAVLNETGRIIRVNRTVEDWSLASVGTSRGKGLHELLHPQCKSADCPLRVRLEQLWKLLQREDFGVVEFSDPSSGVELRISLARNRRQVPELLDQGYAFVVIDDGSTRRSLGHGTKY